MNQNKGWGGELPRSLQEFFNFFLNRRYLTHVDSKVLQSLELAQTPLQLGVDVQGLGFGILEEGPKFLQAVQLTCRGEKHFTAQFNETSHPSAISDAAAVSVFCSFGDRS